MKKILDRCPTREMAYNVQGFRQVGRIIPSADCSCRVYNRCSLLGIMPGLIPLPELLIKYKMMIIVLPSAPLA